MNHSVINLSSSTSRRLSVLVYGTLLLAYPIEAAFDAMPSALSLLLSLAKLVALLGCIVLFLSPHSQQGNAPDSMLDERERQERSGAHILAFQILLGLLILANLYLIVARLFAWWMPDSEDLHDLLGALVIAALALPGTVLAWQVRAPVLARDE